MGQNIPDWFKRKYQGVRQTLIPHIQSAVKPETDKNKGFKI